MYIVFSNRPAPTPSNPPTGDGPIIEPGSIVGPFNARDPTRVVAKPRRLIQ